MKIRQLVVRRIRIRSPATCEAAYTKTSIGIHHVYHHHIYIFQRYTNV